MTADARRQRLLAAALKLFARQGYQGTTTRQIAHAAGVTEAIVFRHFPRKQDLYWAVIAAQCATHDGRPKLHQLLEADSGQTDAEIFIAIGEDILRRNTRNSVLPRLLLYSALENHELSHRFFRTYISEYYETVAERIRERIRTGSFRTADPLLAARSFIGMFFYHFLIQELFGGKKVQEFDPAEVSRTLTLIWLQGMANNKAEEKDKINNGKRNGHVRNGRSSQ